MEIKLLGEVTTEQALLKLEAEAEKYTGLYVDMSEAKGRKYVKEQAEAIKGILTSLNRARIDKSKLYKQSVESEAEAIRLRLEAANEPFTLLIDEWNAERKAILDKEKADAQAKQDAIDYELDHEMAILLNIKWDSEKDQREQARIDNENAIAEQAKADLLAQQERDRQLEESKVAHANAVKERDEQRRINNVEHQRKVNNEVLADLTEYNLSEEQAILVIKALKNGKIRNVTINY